LEAVGSFGLLAAIAKELNCLRCIVKAFSHTFVRTRHLFSSRGNCSVLASVFVFLTMNKGLNFGTTQSPYQVSSKCCTLLRYLSYIT
jgi:hypothetical protein